jgi:hypothetical protein
MTLHDSGSRPYELQTTESIALHQSRCTPGAGLETQVMDWFTLIMLSGSISASVPKLLCVAVPNTDPMLLLKRDSSAALSCRELYSRRGADAVVPLRPTLLRNRSNGALRVGTHAAIMPISSSRFLDSNISPAPEPEQFPLTLPVQGETIYRKSRPSHSQL